MDYSTLKKEVAAILQDVPNRSLPLFKFREIFEKRYRRSVSSCDLYRMKDVVTISDNSTTGLGYVTGRRIISLSSDWNTEGADGLVVFCRLHPPMKSALESARLGWAEREIGVSLPNVEIEFNTLSQRIGNILDSHDGGFPLFSFMDCYASEFGQMERVDDGSGVPLEHLIASVHGVEIIYADNGMKRVQWKIKKEFESGLQQIPLDIQLAQLSRELVDLIKTFPKCSIPFSKLIPAYHHHFGRQCRVADYGHLTLSSLLQTLPMTIQVIGEGPNRVITLAHKAQMKRFATDVLRVLKGQLGIKKQIRLEDFPMAFGQLFPVRAFSPEDYGLCFFSDLVLELVENFTIVSLVTGDDGEKLLAIPKREQSHQEVQKTRIFAAEVVELLGHSIRCEMQFSKFIPSYHHHFGRQCRVSDFGFSKLAELFDSISDTVISENPHPGVDCNPEDKMLRLTPLEQIKVVGDQIRGLVQNRMEKGIVTRLAELEDIFLSEFGFALRVDLCGALDILNLINQSLSSWVKLDGDYVQVSDNEQQPTLEKEPLTMNGSEFLAAYGGKNNTNLDNVEKNLNKLGISQENSDEAKQMIQAFGKEMADLLEESGGYLAVQNIESAYSQKYGRQIIPAQLGYPSMMSLLQGIPNVATLRGKFRTKRILVLNRTIGTRGNSTEGRGATTHMYNNQVYHGGYNNGNKYGHKTSNYNGSQNLGNGTTEWSNGITHLNFAPPQSNVAPPPLFSPLLSSPTYRTQDTNIFNFEQQTSLSSPIYDLWMTDTRAPGSPPISPPIVWAYHPICYPPSPGSPNMLIPGFSYAPWNHAQPQPQNQPIMNPTCFEFERVH